LNAHLNCWVLCNPSQVRYFVGSCNISVQPHRDEAAQKDYECTTSGASISGSNLDSSLVRSLELGCLFRLRNGFFGFLWMCMFR